MQQESYNAFNDAVLAEALARYGIEPNAVTRIESYDSFIYALCSA